MVKLFLILGTLNAGLCVVLGAFAAHKLKTIVEESAIDTFQTGVQYHFYHSLALILLALLMLQFNAAHEISTKQLSAYFHYAGYAFMLGIILFSGSLYGLSLGGWKVLGPITPIGGLLFISAWMLMSFGVYKSL